MESLLDRWQKNTFSRKCSSPRHW